MVKVAWAAIAAALLFGIYTINGAYEAQRALEAKVVEEAKLVAERAEQKIANEARLVKYEEVMSASDAQLGEVAKLCAEEITRDIARQNPYRWTFTGLDRNTFRLLKNLAYSSVPMSSYDLETSMDLPIAMNVKDARATIKNNYGPPMTMTFVIYRSDDSFSGQTRSLRLYTCYLDLLTVQTVGESDAVFLPD